MKKIFVLIGVISFSMSSCLNDLDVEPVYDVTSASVYNDFESYKMVLAKLYGGYVLTGQQGGGDGGDPDIISSDDGMFSYIRAYWNLQEIPTDEAILGWGNEGDRELNTLNFAAENLHFQAMFDRIYFQIALANEFLRETTEDKLAERGVSGARLEEVAKFRAEARFLRALSYWHAMDLYGNVPFVTEEHGIGSFLPEQYTRTQLFEFIESELLSLVDEEGNDDLIGAMENEYGRADKAAAWTLLAKLYLNAQVYVNQDRYTDALTYAKNVIAAGYQLESNYAHLFMADNHRSSGIIFSINSDGQYSRNWGGTTFIINASQGGGLTSAENLDILGVTGSWAGLRTTKALVNLFPDETGEADQRAMFFSEGQQLEIEDIGTSTQGYWVTKFKNVTRDGAWGSDPGQRIADTDFPMFRLADVYLIYAEAVLRGGQGGDISTATGYINDLRMRAYGDASGNIAASQLDLDFILDERARELYYEAHRRTDLIRYGYFTSNEYLWPWKGGTQEGSAVESYKTLYPIPNTSLATNPALKQNPGYSN